MAILVGLNGPAWGTTDETYGIVENIEENARSEVEVLDDGNGDPVAAVYYGTKGDLKMDLTVTVTANAPGPATPTNWIGHRITITDGEFAGIYWVAGVGRARTKKGYMTATVEANRYPTFVAGYSTTTAA
jgi:hypothetical protein